jgi:hypothetical protein
MNEVRIFLSNSAVLWIVSKKIARGCSLWTRLFFLIKSNLRSVVQWIITLCFTGLLKIRVFRRTRRWIYQKLLSGVKYYLWFPIDFSCEENLLILRTSIHLGHPLRLSFVTSMWMRNFIVNKMGTPHSNRDIWCYMIKLAGRMYRTKKKCWIPFTFTRFDVSRLSIVEVCEGSSVSYKTKNTGEVTWRHGGIVGSYPNIHHVWRFPTLSFAEFRSACMLILEIATLVLIQPVSKNHLCTTNTDVY